ncbi:MAG TPA: hypothetical protein VMV32_01725 [Ignavibacteriaceae bacterium]|nr:hypothetical protein [Ignavibacteriaceae bacterium]
MYGEDVLPMFRIPAQMNYEKMIHELAKIYGQCKYHIANTYRETDFWEMLCFENLEGAKTKYKMEKKK